MINKTVHKASNRFVELLGSRGFYRFILVLFVFEAIWIAFSALYPQAFDEQFHYGIIKVYSHYWLPFLSHQPPNADAYGAVARDPSYLYHYLMSFPYRLLALFLHSQTSQVIALRLIDVGFVLWGLVLFKRVLARVGLSPSLINFSLLFFILIPIVPQLAAQVNYDDLLFPLTAWLCLQVFDVIDDFKRRRLSAQRLLTLLITALFASLVKYAFLPMLFSAFVFVVALIWWRYRTQLGKFCRDFIKDFRKLSRKAQVILVVLIVLSTGLLMQRDGWNLVKYHSIVPDCAHILSVKQCSAYSAWYVDYQRHQDVLSGSTPPTENLISYTGSWFYWMWYRLFFAVNGATSDFASAPPLPLPGLAAILVAALGLVAILRYRHQLFHNNLYLLFLLSMSLIYGLALFVKGYATYHHTAVLENMNGRYLVPILLPLAALVGLAFSVGLHRSSTKKVAATLVVLVLLTQGGGILTFMLRSDPTWYWDNPTVEKVNKAAKRVVKHVVVKNQ